MTAFDANANLALATVTVAPAPPGSGTTLTVDDASPFPVAPFYALAWPPDVCATLANAEIVRVTLAVGNVFTITRAQGGTSAQAIAVGWQFANVITAEVIDAIEAAINVNEADIATIFATAVFDGDAAGGALAGTYPNPDLNSALAGAGLGFLANVLSVKVDGTTIQINGSNQLEVISSGVLTDAVIKAPGTSVRNTITSTGNFIELPISGASGQTVDLLNVGIFGASSPFFRVVPGQAVGIGAGTYDPAVYGTNVVSRFVLSQSQATVATGGPAIDPGSSGIVRAIYSDVEIAPSVGTNTQIARTNYFNARLTGANNFSGGIFAAEGFADFVGTKTAASGSQAARVYGLVGTAETNASSTGDVTSMRAIVASALGRGTGTITNVEGINVTGNGGTNPISGAVRGAVLLGQLAGTNAGGTVPSLVGAEISCATSNLRVVTEAVALAVGVTTNTGGIVASKAISINDQSTVVSATASYAIYSAGGANYLASGATATVIPLTIHGATAQSGRLTRWEDSASALLLGVSAAGVLEWGSAADTNLYRGAADQLKTDDDLAVGANQILGAGGYHEMVEITVPTTPAANKLRLFCRDSGGGLTQLVAVFASGNTVVIAEDF